MACRKEWSGRESEWQYQMHRDVEFIVHGLELFKTVLLRCDFGRNNCLIDMAILARCAFP